MANLECLKIGIDMRYIVYTDAAASEKLNAICGSYLIMTNQMYIDSGFIRVQGIANPAHGESIAIAKALTILSDIGLSTVDVISINVDCASAISFCNGVIKGKLTRSSSEEIRNVISVINSVKYATINITKVKAHTGNMNSNTFVDRLAKIGLRGI